jgi:hypothetical protein
MFMFVEYALVIRMMGFRMGMRMIMNNIAMRMLVGMNDNFSRAAASYTILGADFPNAFAFRTCFGCCHCKPPLLSHDYLTAIHKSQLLSILSFAEYRIFGEDAVVS